MDGFMDKLLDVVVPAGGKIILALLVWIVGSIVIKKVIKLIQKGSHFQNMDTTVYNFATNFIKVVLYTILVVSIISILGVPMASVITVLASAGVAVGMALQGALSNLAGGILLLVLRPFNVGDYISAGGGEGFVQTINLFYTVVLTIDNKNITIPNGTLMSATVTNFTREEKRRVDLVFSVAKASDVDLVEKTMIDVMNANEQVIKEPEPFARVSGGTNEAMEFTLRAWCKSEEYWDVYFQLMHDVIVALGKAGIEGPAVRVITEEKKA